LSAARKTAAATTLPVLSDWYLRSRLKMRQIRLLVALDEHRNVHRAAESLATTQPAATRLLGDLEKLLGLRLFERSARGLTPNAYGESLIRHARVVLSALDHSRDEINALLLGTTGKIVVGTLLVAAPMLVPRAVARFKVQHPRHTVLIREGTTATLVEALKQGQLDLVVGRAWADFAGEGLRFEAFYSEPMRVVARVGHPLARAGAIKLDRLAEWPWIFPPPETAFRKRLEAAFRQVGVGPPLSIVESMSILTNITLVRETDMLCVLPRDVARHYARSDGVRILDVKLPAPSGPVGIITAAGRALPPAASDLVQALREAARDVAALRY
jgi:DNA-binding transcriptional LysR family regulator